jgi:tetratricopeptide (TPR) repeat protein
VKCLGADAKLAGIWELPSGAGLSPRKQAIRRAFMATGKRYAADSFTVVMNALDRYVTEWNGMHREACEATNIRGEQSSDVLDLRMSCLHDRFSEVRALTNVFSDASGEVVAKSAEAAQALRSVEQCADIVALRAVVRPPDDPNVRRAVADVRTQLADVKALASAGRYKQASRTMSEVVDASRRTKYSPVVAEALLQQAELYQSDGNSPKAEASFEEAIFLAESSHHDEVMLEAADQLIATVGYEQSRHREAQRWARFAAAILERLGPGHDILAAWRENNLAMDYLAEGRPESALQMFEAAVKTKIRALGEVHFDVAISMDNVALTLHEVGHIPEAIEKNQRAIDIFRKTLGPDHPLVANALANGAHYMNSQARYAQAQEMAEQALATLERELDPDHPDLAFPLTTIAVSWIKRGRPMLAIPMLERALAIRQAKDSRPELLGETRFALAEAFVDANHGFDRGLSLAKQAQADYRKIPGAATKVAAIDQWIAMHSGIAPHISMR